MKIIDWTARYRVVDARKTTLAYYAADTREAIATWLDAHAEWIHTYSADHQSRVSRSSRSTQLEIVERHQTVTTEGVPETRWVRSIELADLIGRITPGHASEAQMA